MGLILRLSSVSMSKALMSYLPAPSGMDDVDFARDPVGPRDSAEPPEGEFEAHQPDLELDSGLIRSDSLPFLLSSHI